MTSTSSELLERFLSNQKPNTQKRYRTALRDFERTTKTKLKDADYNISLDYLQILRGRIGQFGTPLASATIENYYNILTSMAALLVSAEMMRVNPFKAAKKLFGQFDGYQKRPTKLIPFNLVRKIIESVGPSERWQRRDQAILALFFGGGLRRSELLSLNVGDIGVTPSGKLFLIIRRSKAREAQERILPKWAWKYWSALVAERKQQGAEAMDPLVITSYNSGLRMSQERIYCIYKKYLKRYGIDAAPHSARATFASRLKTLGASDRSVGAAMGHKNETSVRIYDKVSGQLELNPAHKINY